MSDLIFHDLCYYLINKASPKDGRAEKSKVQVLKSNGSEVYFSFEDTEANASDQNHYEQWKFTQVEGQPEVVSIVHEQSGKTLSGNLGAYGSKQLTMTKKSDVNREQQRRDTWKLESNKGGYFYIRNSEYSNKVIELNHKKNMLSSSETNNLVTLSEKNDGENQLWKLVLVSKDCVYNLGKLIPENQCFYIVSPSGGLLSYGDLALNEHTISLGTKPDAGESLKFKYKNGRLLTCAPNGEQACLLNLKGIYYISSRIDAGTCFDIFLSERWIKFQERLPLGEGKYINEVCNIGKSSSFKPTHDQNNDGVYFEIIFVEDGENGSSNKKLSLKEASLSTSTNDEEIDIELVSLLWHFTGGFILALGVVPILATGEIRFGIFGVIRSHRNGAIILDAFEREITRLTANRLEVAAAVRSTLSIVKILFKDLYDHDLLLPVLKIICSFAGAALLFRLLRYVLLNICFPGVAGGVTAAELVASSTIWAIQGVNLAYKYGQSQKRKNDAKGRELR